MPPLTPSSVHADRPVTNFLAAYPDQEFVGHAVAPIIPVDKESDTYWELDPSDRTLIDSTRAAGTPSKEVAFDYVEQTYAAKEYALHADIPGRVLRNADNPIAPRRDAAMVARAGVLLDIERRIAAIAQATTLPKDSPTVSWNASTLSSIRAAKDVLTGIETIRQKIGRKPNNIIIPSPVANALRIWMLEYKVGAGVQFQSIEPFLTAGMLPPTLWGLKVHEPGAAYSTAASPASVSLASLTDVWADNVTIFYANPMPAMRAITFMATFRVRGSELAMNGKYTGPRDPDDQFEEYRVIEAHKLISSACAYMIENVLA